MVEAEVRMKQYRPHFADIEEYPQKIAWAPYDEDWRLPLHAVHRIAGQDFNKQDILNSMNEKDRMMYQWVEILKCVESLESEDESVVADSENYESEFEDEINEREMVNYTLLQKDNCFLDDDSQHSGSCFCSF